MWGSAMNLMGTGMFSSHALKDLSSEVVMKRRSSSTKVMVLIGPRWWSYSWVISPERVSYWIIFLSDMPAKNSCGDEGLNLMQ